MQMHASDLKQSVVKLISNAPSDAARALGGLLALLLGTAPVPAQADMRGPYAHFLEKLQFDKPFSISSPSDPRTLKCLSSEEDSNLIGLIHEIRIKAPFSTVMHVFENYEDYTEIFDSLRKSKITKKEGTSVFIDFEGAVPFFLVPNSKYSMIYKTVVDRTLEKESPYKVYSFELNQSKDLKSLDGVAIIRSLSGNETLYQEIDFLDANWGAAKVFAPGAIWKDSVEEIIATDVAMKIRAEEPSLSAKEVKKKTSDAEDDEQIKACIKDKRPAKAYLTLLSPEVINKKKEEK